MTAAQPVKIAWASPFKAPTVLVAGQLITDAERVVLDCTAGEPPKVFVEFGQQAVEDIEVEGVVHLVRQVPADPLKIVAEFLENIDAVVLQAAVLEGADLDGQTNFAGAALEQLKAWARGD